MARNGYFLFVVELPDKSLLPSKSYITTSLNIFPYLSFSSQNFLCKEPPVDSNLTISKLDLNLESGQYLPFSTEPASINQNEYHLPLPATPMPLRAGN
jgi:hypothetical protein